MYKDVILSRISYDDGKKRVRAREGAKVLRRIMELHNEGWTVNMRTWWNGDDEMMEATCVR